MTTPAPRLAGAPLLPDGRPAFVLSADGGAPLASGAADLARYLRARPAVPLTDVAAALVGTRELRRHRALIHTDDRGELLAALDALAADRPAPGLHTGRAATGAPAFVFPGQGSQRRGMGALFHARSAAYRTEVDRVHAVSLELFGTSPRDYLLGTGEWAESGPAPVEVVQPAIFMQALGLVAMWRAAGITPRIHLGHSQGEIAAAVAAGTVGLADGVRLVTRRALVVRDHAPTGHSMAVLGTDRERCAAMLARVTGFAELSVVNSAHVLCISGERDVVTGVVERAAADGVFAREIRVEYPAHTSLVGTLWHLRDAWMGDIERHEFAPTGHTLIGGTLGEAVTGDIDFADYWFWNLRNPVRFDLATRAALDAGADRLIEIAEHPTLQLALLENVADAGVAATVTSTSRRDAADLSVFASAVADVLVTHAADLDALRTGTAALPPDFPAAPLAATALWAPGPTPAPGPRRPAPRVLHTAWRAVTEQVTAPPRPLAIVDPSGTRAELAAALVTAAARYGAAARLADRAGDDEIAVVLAPGVPAHAEPIEAVGRFLADRTWWAGARPAAGLAVVTAGAVADGAAPDGAGAAIAAGFRSFAADLPGLGVRHLDLDPGVAPSAQAAAAVHALHLAGEPRLALRDGGILAERWLDAAPTDPAPTGAPEAATHAGARHIVISGGTGHLGLAFAADAAARGAHTVTLLSRSGETPAARHALARVRRRFSAEITAVNCDITDPDAVRSALADRPVDTVVHTAVGYRRAAAGELGAEQFGAAAAAKVTGLRNLAAAAPGAAIVACSSAASALPGAGQAWYAAANALLEAELAGHRDAGRDARAVRWGLWEQAGPLDEAGFAAVTATGMVPMAAPDALTALATATGAEPVILAADLPRLRAVADALGAGALFAELDAPADAPAPARPAPARTTAAPSSTAPTAPAPGGTPAPDSAPDAEAVLRRHLATVLAVAPDAVEADVALVALGLDSLQALELRTAVRAELGTDIPLEAVLGGATLTELSAALTR